MSVLKCIARDSNIYGRLIKSLPATCLQISKFNKKVNIWSMWSHVTYIQVGHMCAQIPCTTGEMP